MQLWVRPYNADAGILEAAVNDGFRPHGVMLDANIAVAYPNVLKRVIAATEGLAFAIDPNTSKIRSLHFRSKKTYRQLPFFAEEDVPSLDSLRTQAGAVAKAFTDLQKEYGATVLLSPYLLLEEGHFPASAQLEVQRAWYASFSPLAKARPVYFSLCITVQALATPEGFNGALQLLRTHKPENVYLLLADFDLGEDPPMDGVVTKFLGALRKEGVKDILLGRGPAWASLLIPYGLSGYVTGINFMASLKREYFSREEDIGGITHNYYLPRRFMKATPVMVDQLIAEDVIDACDCPVCEGGIPYDVNEIRRHYLFARSAEAEDLSKSANPRTLARGWVSAAGDLIQQADALSIDLTAPRPPVSRWAKFLA